MIGRLYSKFGVGLLFYPRLRQCEKPINGIRQDTILTPFLCNYVNVSTEDKKHENVRMASDIFNLNNEQPHIESDRTDSQCPVCGYHIDKNTKVCPNCHEIIWQDSEPLDSDNEPEQTEVSPKEKEIKKHEAQYNAILTIIALVIAVPLVWITYNEFADQQWGKAVWFVLVAYLIICRFIGYLLKGVIRSMAKRKVDKR